MNRPPMAEKKHEAGRRMSRNVCGSASPMDSSGGSKSNREMRGSRGGSRLNASNDEARDVIVERSESITSHDGHSTVRDLSFDLEQPWQRSLLRELENIEKSGEKKNARSKCHKILLGRAASGDYLVEYDDTDDDDTVMTDASSTIPMRPQVVHRQLWSAHSALFKDEEEEEYGAVSSTDSSLDRKAILEPRPMPSPVHRARPYDSDFIRERDGSNSKREEGPKGSPLLALPLGLSRANALTDDRSASQYLKSARGVGVDLRLKSSEETSGNNQHHTANEADYQNGAACICMGYNFLDFLLPANYEHLNTRHKKRRTSLITANRRPSVLDRVTEEETPESIFLLEPPAAATTASIHSGNHLRIIS